MAQPTASILVIEDNPANLKLVRVLLSAEGYEVRTAVDAEEALRVLQTYRPRLILTDIQLPGMDGLELTRRLRRDPAWAHTAIVALTAYAMKGDDDKALAAGCDGYITKPLDPDTFSSLILDALTKRRPTPDPVTR
jgi:two-component system cell cycle response regulator DivK